MAKQAPLLIRGTSHPRWFTAAEVVVVLAGVAAGFAGFDALRRFPPNPTVGYAGLGAFGVALVAAILLAVLTKRELVVDSQGIEERSRGKSVRIQWSEPHELYYRAMATPGTTSLERLTLKASDGRQIDVDEVSVPDNPDANAARVVEHYSTAATWSRVQEQLEAGEEVSFAAATMSQKTLRIGTVTHAMDKPVCFQVEKGLLRVGSEGKWLDSQVRACDVANYPSLLRAIGQVSTARPPG